MSGKVQPIPKGYEGATPYLIIKGAAKALDFYKKGFGATEIMRIPPSGGTVGHAEIKIGEAIIMLADEFHAMNHRSPQALGGTPVSIMVYVPDVERSSSGLSAPERRCLKRSRISFMATGQAPWKIRSATIGTSQRTWRMCRPMRWRSVLRPS